ncbi:kunitz-like toxin PcKuz1 [Physella acuta]|uniref:kunitz-like toxin PcKuz1 n=1 Tax=Physella acuta TaxID=109671 RepID=UPI0027DC2A97|nr:kunitz-like toxin PcKuz1 [Physella acuta]
MQHNLVAVFLFVVGVSGYRQDTLAGACTQPKDVGPCDAIIPRWYFNSATHSCEAFDYGGCGGNDNNFLTQTDCLTRCVTHLG